MEGREWAHAYLDVGWSILPLQHNKLPYHQLLFETGYQQYSERDKKMKASWNRLAYEKPSHETVDQWFDHDEGAGVGIICGRISDLTVIDIDVKNIDNAVPAEDIAQSLDLFTLSVHTPSGGLHLYCKYDKDVPTSTKKLHGQIDTKNDQKKSYIATVPTKGYRYDDLTPFTVANVKNMAFFPKKLKEKINTQEGELKNTLFDWFTIMNGVKESGEPGRNTSATELVGKLTRAVLIEFGEMEVFLPHIWEFMVWWNANRCDPPMSSTELEKCFKSIVTRATYGSRKQ